MDLVQTVSATLLENGINPTTAFVAAALGIIIAFLLLKREKHDPRLPPMVPYTIPWIGSTIEFGKDPLKFLLENRVKYGDVFTYVLLGRKLTYFIGPEANGAFVNAKGSFVSAEAAYAALTVPVFGKGVIYDVPNAVMVEQKKMCKGALTHEAFEAYVPLIEKECRDYLVQWGNEGKIDILQALSEITIMTASRTLLGKEVRSRLHSGVADLYHDLDKGFTPLNFLFPNLPLPSYRKRDEAHIKMRELFMDVIQKRKESKDFDNHDLMQTLMDATYKDGSKMTDQEVAHMMIAVLMAGQHTSSTTGSWLGLHMVQDPKIIEKVNKERYEVFGGKPFHYEGIRELTYLDQVLRETLRICPPLIQVMRKVVKDLQYENYVIPAGHYICVSPTATHHIPTSFPQPEKFDPERFAEVPEATGDDDDSSKAGRYSYLPFGAGRHRCIGEQFAFVQIKTMWSTILELYDIFPDGPIPKPDYQSLVVLPSKPCNIRYKRKIPLAN